MHYLINTLALLPIVVFLVVIYKKDRLKPEPVGQLFKAFLYGVLSVPLSFVISLPLHALGAFTQNPQSVSEAIAISFFGAAIPEETAKLFLLWFFLRNNKYFDEKVDGIVYAACITLGFAAFENIMYLYGYINNFVMVAAVRAMFAIPGHFSFGILMGYYYSLVVFYPHSKRHTTNMVMLWCGPVLLHGLYDTLLFSMSKVNVISSLVIFCTFIYFCVKMWKYVAKRIDEHLKRDMAQGSEQDRLRAIETFRRLVQKDSKRYEADYISILDSTAQYFSDQEQVEKADSLYLELVDIYKSKGDTLSMAHYLSKRAYIKPFADALPILNEVFDIYNNNGMHREIVLTLEGIGICHMDLEQYPKARHFFIRAINLFQSSGVFTQDDTGSILASLYFYMGEAFCQDRLYDEAVEYYQMAEKELNPDLFSPTNRVMLYRSCTECHSFLDQYQACYDTSLQGLALCTAPEYSDMRADMLNALSDACIFLGKYDEAEQYAQECIGIDADAYKYALCNLASSYLFRGMFDQAEPIYIKNGEELSEDFLEDINRYEAFGIITDALRPDVERVKAILSTFPAKEDVSCSDM